MDSDARNHKECQERKDVNKPSFKRISVDEVIVIVIAIIVVVLGGDDDEVAVSD